MALLPAGFVLPPLPYFLGLVLGVFLVGVALWRLEPSVSPATVLGLAPWMAVGSALHVLYVIEAVPTAVRPFLGTPAVYATGFIGLGAAWVAATYSAGNEAAVARTLGLLGTAVFAGTAVLTLVVGTVSQVVWSGVGAVLSILLAAATWQLLQRVEPGVAAMGSVGTLVLFAHALDGVSTAIGVDVLGFGERTPASRLILEVAAGLPTAEILGVGWLFVLVKLGIAGAVVALFVDFVEETPRQGYLLLAVIAAVGLGPGVHNLLLYMVAT